MKNKFTKYTISACAAALTLATFAVPANAQSTKEKAAPEESAIRIADTETALLIEAGPEKVTQDCVLNVDGQQKDGQYTGEISCSARPEGEPAYRPDMEQTAQDFTTVSASSGIAYHYTGSNYSGSLLTVNGTTCGGGWINLSSSWTNVISSHSSSCTVKYYDLYYLSGAVEVMYGSGNLYSLNDRANSVQYI